MDRFIIHPESQEQNAALQMVLDALKIPYDIEPSSDVVDNIKAGLNEIQLFEQDKLKTTDAKDFLKGL